MSSDERAKPPATYEERNPFDISRRSENEVAAEIARRMAAWKQARARSHATPTTVPGPEATLPPISAPVQPARLPKFGEHAAHAQPAAAPQPATAPRPDQVDTSAVPVGREDAKPAGAAERAPLFAAFRRAMPPAPGLDRPSARPKPRIETPRLEAARLEAPRFVAPETESAQTAPPRIEARALETAEANPAAPVPATEIEVPGDETRADETRGDPYRASIRRSQRCARAIPPHLRSRR